MKGGLRGCWSGQPALHTVCALVRPSICLLSGSENLLRVSMVDSFQEVRSRRYIKPRSALPGRKTQLPASQVFTAVKAAVRAPPTEHIEERQPGEQGAGDLSGRAKAFRSFTQSTSICWATHVFMQVKSEQPPYVTHLESNQSFPPGCHWFLSTLLQHQL